MTKKEFLDGLKQSLIGNISNAEMNSKIDYYSDYFANEKNKGRNEEDICKELGDPKLIAKTIIDTNTSSEDAVENISDRVIYEDGQSDNTNDSHGSSRFEYIYSPYGCSGVSGCLVLTLVMYLIIGLISYIFRGALNLSIVIFSSPLAAVIAIALIIYIISKKR